MKERIRKKVFLQPVLYSTLIGCAVFALGLLFGYLRNQVVIKESQAETREVLEIIAQNIQYVIREVNSVALLLSQTVDEEGVVSDFESVSADLLEKYPTINVLEIIDDGVVTHVFPSEGYEEVLGFDLYQNERIKREIFIAASSGSIYLAGPSMLVEGELGVIGLLPFYVDGDYIRISAVVLYLDTLLEEAQLNIFRDRYYFELSKINLATGVEEFFLNDVSEFDPDQFQSIEIKEGDWILYTAKIEPVGGLFAIFLFASVSLMAAILLGYLSYQIFSKPLELEGLLNERTEELFISREQFRQSSELLASVLESPQNIVIFSLDNEFRYIGFNRNYKELVARFFKVDIEAGTSIFDVYPPKTKDSLRAKLERVLNGDSFDYIDQIPGTNDTVFYWQNWFSPVKDKEEQIIGVTVFSVDITKRITAEQELERNEGRLRTLISNSPYCIHELNTCGSLISINEAGIEMFNLEESNIEGEHYSVIMGKENADSVQALFEKTVSGTATEFEFSIDDRHFESLFIPIKGESDTVNRVMGITQDITERKKSESIIESSLHEKTTLLSEIHHRVKNNLAIVSGLLELQKVEMDDHRLTAAFNQSINRIISIAMVHELMYNTDDLSSVDVHAYLEKLIPAISATMQSKMRNVQFHLDIDSYSLNINDAIPLGLLLNELITNSFKYAFKGKAENKIEIILNSENDRVFVKYSDNGRGFPEDINFHSPKNLGLNLIHAQLDQLGATFKAETRGKFELDFSFTARGKGSHSNM